MTIEIGIIGCGRAATTLHLPALARVDGVRITALADRDEARAIAAADQAPGATIYRDAAGLLDHEGLDAVLVAIPPRAHGALARQVGERGLHLLLEKPVAASPAEAREVVDAFEGSDRRAAVGHNLRCHRLVARARREILDGTIGDPVAVRTIWTSDIGLTEDVDAWSARRSELGGSLHEIGVHHFDLVRFLLGLEFEEVFVVSHDGRREDAACSINARLVGGVPVSMVLSQETSVEHRVEILGSESSLELDCYRFDGLGVVRRGSGSRLGSRLRRAGSTLLELPAAFRIGLRGGDYLDSFRLEWESFVAAIVSGGAVHCSLEDGLRSVELTHAAALSAGEGRPVRLEEISSTGGGP